MTIRGKTSARRVVTGSRLDEAMQAAARDQAQLAALVPFGRGKLISVKFPGTPTVVTHGLGVPAACMVIRQNYDGSGGTPRVCEGADQSGIDTKNQLRIGTDIACTLDLWFYPRSSKVIPTGATQST